MRALLFRKVSVGAVVAAAGLTACGTAPPAPTAAPPAAIASAAPTAAATNAPDAGPPVPIPVTADDPTWGSAEAPVTIVLLSDFQCPFCDRARSTLEELKEAYGPDKLRVVWKDQPLSFHKDAEPAARAAAAVFALEGNDGFWRTHHALFNRQATLADATSQVLERARAAHGDLAPALARADRKLEGDKALALATHNTGTPGLFINGLHISGAQPFEKLQSVIDEQLQKAAALVKQGVPAGKVYGELTRAQLRTDEAKPDRLDFGSTQEAITRKLPVGKSPVRGPADALVTLVLLTDLSCSSCRIYATTTAEVMAARKDKVRLVIKYSRAYRETQDSALHVAIEARAKKGDAAFWKVFDALQGEASLDDAALERAAKAAGLPAKAALDAAHDDKHKAIIDADEEALDEAGAGWTPSLYLNGRSVSAYSAGVLARAVDEEIAAAEKVVAAGTPRAKLYEKLLESATPAPEPEKSAAPAPAKDTPGHGPAGSKALLQIFGNFESQATDRLFGMAVEMEKEFPGKVRVVFHHLPLAVQPGSPLAAEAANEAFAQKGDEGFWSMAKLLFAGRPRIDGFEKPALLRYGAQAGLDAQKLGAALDQRTHGPEVAAESALARRAGIRAPTMLLNDMVLAGPAPRLRRFLRKLLAAK